MKKILSKVAHHYRDIPNKKPYIEFFTALLSIPVLLTVILLNLNSLRTDKTATTAAPTPASTAPEKIYVTVPQQQTVLQPTKAPSQPCTPGIGQVTIASPSENQVVTDNPTLVTITYDNQGFCEVVWAYRVNGGNWSDYDNNSISLYNLPQGQIKLELKIKSVVNSDTDSLTRNFTYKGTSIVPTAPVASSSAN